MGRVSGSQYPDNTTATNLYYVTGLLRKTWGSRIYPVEYTYDPQGRLRTLKTWQNFAADAATATTRWNYDPYRGWLNSKDYPDAATGNPPGTEGTAGPLYTYKLSGRLWTRVWKRGVTTTYAYNNAGDLQTVSYSDGTPGVTNTYDRRGRRGTAVRNGITTTWTYNDANQPLTESHAGGTLAALSMTWTYDTALRRQTVSASKYATAQQAATYGYDTAGRLQTVTDAPYAATYAYHANSTLISTVGLTNGPGTGQGVAVRRTYDRLNRLQTVSSVSSASPALAFTYGYNDANQRVRATLADGSYWIYDYDALGQVISGKRSWADGTPVAGQQFEYRFDDIGNRDTTGGRASSVSDYTANRRNQYESRTVAPYVDVTGIANPTAGVTVNGNTASRKGEYFHWPLNVPNGSAQYPTVTVTSQYGAGQTASGKVFVPPAAEGFLHDADGNLTDDGRWHYTWDGENRLIEMKRDVDAPTGARQKLVFEYDHQGRRLRKQFYTYSGGWSLQTDTICLYDGWNVLVEFDGGKNRLRTYVWGTDLSGSEQGAGGVGGLLWVNNYQATYGGQTLPTGVHFVAYDGNGNVAALVQAADGSLSAHYEYGPFAEPVRMTGPLAKAHPFRFSTKWTDHESGLLYYGYRYYNPSTGRWLSRDPLEERGGLNLYAAINGDPINSIDPTGLTCTATEVARCKAKAKAAGRKYVKCTVLLNWSLVVVPYRCRLAACTSRDRLPCVLNSTRSNPWTCHYDCPDYSAADGDLYQFRFSHKQPSETCLPTYGH